MDDTADCNFFKCLPTQILQGYIVLNIHYMHLHSGLWSKVLILLN